MILRFDGLGFNRNFCGSQAGSPEQHDQLERIAVPTLIMVGQEDETTRPVESEQLQARIAGSHVVVLPRTGHLCTVEAPEAVNTTLAAFLNGLQ